MLFLELFLHLFVRYFVRFTSEIRYCYISVFIESGFGSRSRFQKTRKFELFLLCGSVVPHSESGSRTLMNQKPFPMRQLNNGN